jgi:hypothetical protein
MNTTMRKVTGKTYEIAVKKALKPMLDTVEASWGFRPPLVFTTVPKLRIRVWRYGTDWRDDKKMRWYCLDTFFIDAATGESCNKRYNNLAIVLYKQLGKQKATDYTVTSYNLTARGVPKPKGYETSKIKYTAEPFISIKAAFNLKGFAHDGQGFHVSAKNMHTHRQPAQVAKLILREISGHRNTCDRCGVGIAPLFARANDRHYYGGEVNYDMPPDPVEEMLHPRLSKRLKERLENNQIA